MNKIAVFWRERQQIGAEFWIWGGALVALALTSPEGSHFTLCPLATLGFDFCPGCGLGRSITLLFHGRFADSFAMHPLGAFAVLVVLHRMYVSIRNPLKQSNRNEKPV